MTPSRARASGEIPRSAAILLNVAHALDHMFLLIFATAVAAIAADFGLPDRETLMPYGVGAFMLFGLGSLPPAARRAARAGVSEAATPPRAPRAAY